MSNIKINNNELHEEIHKKLIVDASVKDIFMLSSFAHGIIARGGAISKEQIPAHFIKNIAQSLGVKEFKLVPAEECKYHGEIKHAVMKNSIIYLNNSDDEKHHIFSIAHEVCHIVLDEKKGSSVLEQAARSGITWCVQQVQKKYLNIVNDKLPDAACEMLYDYIAAMVLMPPSLFLLHEDKTDEQLSDLFVVPLGSINKRRLEIETELHAIDNPISAGEERNVLTKEEIEQELHHYLKSNR